MLPSDTKHEGLYEKFKKKERKGRFFFTWLVLLVSGGLQSYGIILSATGYMTRYMSEQGPGKLTFFSNIGFPVLFFLASVLGPVFLMRIRKDSSALIYALAGVITWPSSSLISRAIEEMF